MRCLEHPTHNILVVKFQGKMACDGPRSRWEDNIKIDIREIGCNSVDRIFSK
jgi:hypothetical protein